LQENIIVLDVAEDTLVETTREVTEEEQMQIEQDILEAKRSLVRAMRVEYLLALDKLRINILNGEIPATEAEKDELKQYRIALLDLPEAVTVDTDVVEVFPDVPGILANNFL